MVSRGQAWRVKRHGLRLKGGTGGAGWRGREDAVCRVRGWGRDGEEVKHRNAEFCTVFFVLQAAEFVRIFNATEERSSREERRVRGSEDRTRDSLWVPKGKLAKTRLADLDATEKRRAEGLAPMFGETKRLSGNDPEPESGLRKFRIAEGRILERGFALLHWERGSVGRGLGAVVGVRSLVRAWV